MPYIEYVPRRFNRNTQRVIDQANGIIAEYQQAGLTLTLRQLYYQFVARDLLPNRQKEYKRLGNILNDARLAGLVDWDAMEDRTRNLRGLAHWEDPQDAIKAAARRYHTDLWRTQPKRVEVWIEKDALVGVIERPCVRNDVSFFSCRGYTSASELWSAAQRLGEYVNAGQQPVIIHLGDHDPSGLDMTRDIEDRLNLFLHGDYDRGTVIDFVDVEISRIALNMDQVEQYDPPPNPAKFQDPRAGDYIARYGRESWELDALDPLTLESLIEDEIQRHCDTDLWNTAVAQMKAEKRQIKSVSERWPNVVELIETFDALTSREEEE